MRTAPPSYLLSALLASAAVVTLGGVATNADAAISDTKHNLGAGGTVSGQNQVTGGATGEVCVFCHTPHGSDTSAPVPLWNKKLPTATVYTTYAALNSSTMDAGFASEGGASSVGSVSLACLSCHDGAQAMDNMINAPGSGGYDSTGGGAAGRTGATWNWSGSTVTTSSGVLISTATSASMLGTDLKNDHPIGIQYCGGWDGSTCKDGDFVSPSSNGGSGSTAQYWVNTSAGGGNARQKQDMILYTRSFAVNGSLGAGYYGSVECASCHDPHNAAFATNQVSFLRVSQTNSGVCLACHVK